MAESHREEIAKLEALYAGNPGGRVFVHLAEAYRKAGEHERARRILDEGLARHVDSASGYVVLGRVLADMQITDEAEVAFRRVLELDSGNLVALRWLGDLARQSGRTDEAIAHYRELLARNPSNEEVRDLVEIVDREAAGGTARGAVDEPEWQEVVDEPDWQETEPAEPVLEPAEQVTGIPTEPLTPLSAAPGRTGDEEPAEVEFGLVEIEAVSAAGEPEEQEEPVGSAQELSEAGPGAPEGPVDDSMLDIVIDDSMLVESTGDDDIEELSALTRGDEADELEIHLLDPSYSGDEETGVDYADDDFIADLMSAPEEPAPEGALEAGALDVLDSSSPLTLQADDDAGPTPGLTGERDGVADTAEPPLETEAFESTPAVEEFELAGVEPPYADAVYGAGPIDSSASTEPLESEPAAEPSAAESPVETAATSDAEPQAELDSAEPPPLKPHGDELAAAALGGPEEPGPVTETMAELYRAQGFHDRAADVYRALLRHRPFDLRLSERLSEAEADAAAARAEEAAARTAAEPDDEAAGEVWLRGVGAAWGAGDTGSSDNATPYAWTDEPEEAAAGHPISAYLRDLVSWKTAGQRWAERPPSAPQQQPQQAAWSPDDEPWAAAPVGDAWGTAEPPAAAEPWDSDAGQKTETPWREPPADAADSAPGEDHPTGTDAPNAEPADPWLQGGGGAQGDPWAAAGQGAGERADEGSQPWTPLDMESAAASPSTPESEEESDGEDEDLEMFRSWLQSLKK